jgi:hypothetical protein
MSMAVNGTKANHHAIRLATAMFMTNNPNAIELAWRILSARTDDLTSVNAVDKLEAYLKKEKMLSVGTWGTDNEMVVMATMLQVCLHVSTRGSPTVRSWHRFEPLFKNEKCLSPSGVNVYLFHTDDRSHYEMVDILEPLID